MDQESLRKLLHNVAAGKTPVDDAAETLRHIAFEDIDYAHIDHHRSLRKGFPEVIFGQGKTAEQIIGIMEKMLHQENIVLVTRIDPQQAEKVVSRFPEAAFHQDARMVIIEKKKLPIRGKGTILVISAGTSDIPIAKEAYLTATVMGNQVVSVFDVGVAGIHRLTALFAMLNSCSSNVAVVNIDNGFGAGYMASIINRI
jgi:NCAIR mutase (PurE)-related protein